MISDDESGIMLFHSSEFSEGEISPVVVHYPPQRGIVGILFIYLFIFALKHQSGRRLCFEFGIQPIRVAWGGTVSAAQDEMELSQSHTHAQEIIVLLFI